MITRSAALLGASLLVVLAAACGDDGGNNNGSCGDGHVTGSEQCDDGNTSNGDGCSSSCKNESSSGMCGDNTIDVATEQCDDGNTMSGDGCSATCQNEGSPMCGNGAINGNEACDDGDMMSGDGCSSTCQVETGYTCTGTPSVCTQNGTGGSCTAPKTLTLTAMGADLVGTGTGDTSMNPMNLQAAGACDGDTAGAGPDNAWKFTTTAAADVLITLDDTTAFDGGIRLTTTPCDISTEITDIVGGDDGCSDSYIQGGTEVLGYLNLPAGTYYVSIDGYDAPDMGAYSFTVKVSPPGCGNGAVGDLEICDDGNTATGDGCDATCAPETGWNCDASEPSVCQMEGCGDGLLQTGETCDDDNITAGDGCSATCATEPNYTCTGEPSVCVMAGCGNGLIEAAEECDDGNTTNGDRCNSACVLEQTDTEAAEPNNTTALVLGSGSRIIRGSLADQTDVDLYTFTLAATSTVEIETYFTIDGDITNYTGRGTNMLFDCPSSTDDQMVAVFPMGADTTMNAMATAYDVDDGDQYCSYLGSKDGSDNGIETGINANQLVNLAAGTYTIRVSVDPLATTITNRRYMVDLKITPMGGGPVVPAAGDIKINEFLAADGGSTNGGLDSNCDGVLTNSDDEFIEFVNVSNKTLDLTGLIYADALGTKFVFAQQTTGSLTLAPGKAVVLWGGGTPMCAGVTNFFTNGTAHTLSLNDTGDTITLRTNAATPVVIATTTYTAGTIGKSLNLNPDITGTAYVLHDAIVGHVGNASPGKKTDATAF